MSDLRQRLARLGLSQYYDVFDAEGFDTWDTLLDITESDLSLLNVKLGHRRKLQRAIAEFRGQPPDRSLPATLNRDKNTAIAYRSGDDSAPESKDKQGESAATGVGNTGATTKRKYRRHPKPDEHAPERPPSAYVIFSNQVRELLKGQDLSFTEIAKVVGERWQVLPADEREACERQANSAKEKYYAALADYKKTSEYDAYQRYLEDFKAKHAVPTKGKRSKLETETSGSTRSGSYDQDRAANRRFSSVQPDMAAHGHHHQRSGSSPPLGPARLPAGPSYSSKSTSPATHSLSALNSPRTADHYSPVSASPRTTGFDSATTIPGRDPRATMDANASYHPLLYTHPNNHPPSTTPPSHPFVSHYQNPTDLPSRRSIRDSPARLPPLTHEDTTWSSESGQSGSGYNVVPVGFPPPLAASDSGKTMRILPQPVPSIGPSPSPLDRNPIHTSPPTLLPLQPPDYRTQGPLAALVRAGELARVADDEAMDIERSP